MEMSRTPEPDKLVSSLLLFLLNVKEHPITFLSLSES